jgi:dolichol-phosphate mannosyltransferase
MSERFQLSVVIPARNEAENLKILIAEIIQALPVELFQFEIIVVDDGSSDHTLSTLRSLKKTIPQLVILRHAVSMGQSAGVLSGVRAASYPWIATLDGDGQNDPADIPKMVLRLQQEPLSSMPLYMIAGQRMKREDHWIRLFSSKVANGVRSRLLKDHTPDTGCGLKLFRRDIFLSFPAFNHMHRFLPALVYRAGGRSVNHPVNHRARVQGISNYGIGNRLWVGIIDLLGVMWLITRPCQPIVIKDEQTL